MTKSKKTSTKGIFYNFMAMISYSFYPAFIIAFGFISAGQSLSVGDKVTIGFSIVAGKELFTFLIYAIAKTLIEKKPLLLYETIKKHLLNKWGLLAIFAGSLGGPVGYSLLTVGALMIGASSPDAITLSFAIVATILLEKIFFRTWISVQATMGIVIVVLGAVSLVLIQSSVSGWSTSLAYGVGFALLAGFAWGAEAFLANWIMKNNNTKMNSEDFLMIKLSTGSIIAIILMFVVSWSVSQSNLGFDTFSKFFTDLNLLWKIVIVAVSMVFARLFFFKGVKETSSIITSTVVTLQIIVLPLIILFFYFVGTDVAQDDISIMKNYWFWIVAFFLFVGTIMISVPDLKTRFKIKKKQKPKSLKS